MTDIFPGVFNIMNMEIFQISCNIIIFGIPCSSTLYSYLSHYMWAQSQCGLHFPSVTICKLVIHSVIGRIHIWHPSFWLRRHDLHVNVWGSERFFLVSHFCRVAEDVKMIMIQELATMMPPLWWRMWKTAWKPCLRKYLPSLMLIV